MTFAFHPEAEAEFEQAVAFYEDHAEGLGLDFAAEVRDALAPCAELLDSPYRRCRRGRTMKRAVGFTLVELVVILIIVGVLAVAALPRFADQTMFEARGFHDETLSLLRYAQKAAIAQRRTVCVNLNATGVTMNMVSAAGSTNCSATTPLTLPATPRGGAGLTSSAGSFSFRALGNTDQPANVTINIPDNDVITVDAVTGYVY